jgi:amino acid transporter
MDDIPKYEEKVGGDTKANGDTISEIGEVFDNADQLQRHLGNRQIQLIAIGGSIGTAVFVSINSGLYHGGPGSLFLAYAIYAMMLGLVNNCAAEMITFQPVSGGFVRLAGKWVDDAFGFMVRTRC